MTLPAEFYLLVLCLGIELHSNRWGRNNFEKFAYTCYNPNDTGRWGLIEVNPTATSQPRMLAVLLDEATTFENSQGVLRIERNGQVFLN